MIVTVFGVVAVVASITAVWVLWPRGTTVVREQDAVASFRDRVAGATTGEHAGSQVGPTHAPATRPADGVYSYRTRGEETVKLGPLPAEHRTLPDTVTVTVVHSTDACFEVTLSFFVEHSEDTRYCSQPSGSLVLDRHRKRQRIGTLSPTAVMSCDPATIAEPHTATTTLRCMLEMQAGPATLTALLTGTATRGVERPFTIGDRPVTATPITVSYEITGDLSGSWTETTWFSEQLLLVRIERRISLSGPATFNEDSELQLSDLFPAT